MYKLKSVGVLSVAKVLGAMYTLLGLILMPFVLIIGMVGAFAGGGKNPLGAMGGVFLAICLPIVYGLMGFVIGALSSLLYNLMAGWLGGVEFEIQPPAVAGAASIG